MNRASVHNAAMRFLLALLPWCILVVTLGATWFTWEHERENSQKALRAQFDFALRETVSRVEQRVVGYTQMLRGVQSLFATTSLKNRAAMRDYVEALQLDANFSGVQSIGVEEWVPAQHQPAPLGGSDIWSDPVRREAAQRARDSGMVAISGKVQLKANSDPHAPPGFIMYLPIYTQGQAHDSVVQRRAQLIGWVYAVVQMNDFMASLYGIQMPGLTLAIHDGTDNTEASLLYHSSGGAMGDPSRQAAVSANEYMVVEGRSWTLSLSTQAAFEARYGRGIATMTAVIGLVLSLLLALLAWLMVNGRERALRLAAGMTEELRHVAQRDPLTGLPNRALFRDRLNQELARAKRQNGRFAMVFLDLDHFKPINDNFGHDVGDQVLRQVARQLHGSVRAADTVGRIGGDEFVVLLAELGDSEPVLVLAEKLHQAVKQPFVVAGHEMSISCCIGVAVYPQDGADADALTKGADNAMYRAKEAGRDCVRLCNGPELSALEISPEEVV